MVHSCHDLEQYVQFLELVEEARAAGHENPLKWAIQEAVRRNILRDYLERKGGEVLSILMTEYNYATDMAVLKEEAYEDGLFVGLATGREEGREEGAYQTKLETARSFLSEGLDPQMVARCTSLPLETVLELGREVSPEPSHTERLPSVSTGKPHPKAVNSVHYKQIRLAGEA